MNFRHRERTERRYLELRAQGEEPDLLLTRSLEAASFFALDEEESRFGDE